MRSRYTAHVKLAADYLNATQRGPALGTFDRGEMARGAPTMKWLSLRIVSTRGGGEDNSAGAVEFIASFEKDGLLGTHHELSSFVRDNGGWLYTAGKDPRPPTRRPEKIGRNQPCPCGSGRKYKKCCANKC